MTAYVFQQIASKGRAEGIDSSMRQRDARTWFRQAAQDIRSVNRSRMLNDKDNVVSQLEEKNIGQMFTYFYDPKTKETLPYYDTFPLIFLIGFKEKGFMGINLHYLPPVLRAKLMDSLYETINNQKYNETTKLRINYQILAAASRFRYFKPCVKHYLADHVRSDYLNIEPTNWDSALMLPTEQFKKATSEKIWRESRAMV